jgi:lipopolysaccharide transport system permease protein
MPVKYWNAVDLFSQLLRRELQGRYRGTVFGFGAAVVNQLLMLSLYVLVFGFVFQGRYGVLPGETGLDYALGLFVALTLYSYTSDCLSQAPRLILANPNYVKKVVFPLELIPLSANCAILLQMVFSTFPLLLVLAIITHHLTLASLWVVPVLVPLFFINLGVLWLVSAFGVFVRDMQHLVGPINQMVMFGSAVFYSLKSLPQPAGQIVRWNPLAQLFQMARQVVLAGQVPDLWLLGGIALGSVLFCALCFRIFTGLKPAFADVL